MLGLYKTILESADASLFATIAHHLELYLELDRLSKSNGEQMWETIALIFTKPLPIMIVVMYKGYLAFGKVQTYLKKFRRRKKTREAFKRLSSKKDEE